MSFSENKRFWEIIIFWGLILFAGSVFIYRAYPYHGDFVEDAYINFRFSDHLANGYGLVWNIDQEPVEGYTSPLHIALLAMGSKFGLPFPLAENIISYLSLIGLISVLIFLYWKEVGKLKIVGAVVISIFLMDERLAIHVNAGLDTVLYMFLLAVNFGVSVYFVKSPNRHMATILALINLLCLLGRPDAGVYIIGQALTIGIYGIYLYKSRRESRTIVNLALSYSLLIALGSIYLIWKYYYFGYLLPNPFYIKSNDYSSLLGLKPVLNFLRYLRDYFGPLIIAMLFLLDYQSIKAWWGKPGSRIKTFILLVPPGFFLLYYTTVIPEVNYANRFEYPVYFFFCLGTAVFLSLGSPIDKVKLKLGKYINLKLIPVIVGVGLIIFLGFSYRITNIWFPWISILEDNYYRPIANALKSTALRSNASIVFTSAGIVPYESEFTHIDPVGLTDNVLSGREPISLMDREAYIWGKEPDVYIGPDLPASPGAKSCSTDPNIQSRYVQTVLLGPVGPGAWYHIYEGEDYQDRCEALSLRMRELRDNWMFLGEIRYPVPQPELYTHFAYVRKDSPYFMQLTSALEPLIARNPAQIKTELLQGN